MHLDYTTIRRLFSRLSYSPATGCWEWTGEVKANGYGRIRRKVNHRDVHIPVHRAMWEALNGAILGGLFVCHHCDNPRCCNPKHLFLGTHSDNMADCVAKGRKGIKQLPAGTRFGRLVVTGLDSKRSNGSAMFICECDCGKTLSVRSSHLQNGNTRSCGCYKNELSAARMKEMREWKQANEFCMANLEQ